MSLDRRPIATKLDAVEHAALDQAAAQTGVTRSTILRCGVVEWLCKRGFLAPKDYGNGEAAEGHE